MKLITNQKELINKSGFEAFHYAILLLPGAGFTLPRTAARSFCVKVLARPVQGSCAMPHYSRWINMHAFMGAAIIRPRHQSRHDNFEYRSKNNFHEAPAGR